MRVFVAASVAGSPTGRCGSQARGAGMCRGLLGSALWDI